MTSVVDAFRAFGAVLTEPTLLIAPDRRIITGNARAIETFGPRRVQNRPLTDLLRPLRQDVDQWLDLCFGSSHLIPGRFKRTNGHAKKPEILLEGGAFRWEGSIYVLVRVRHHDAVLHKVLDLEEKEQRFRAQSEHDALTGLLNRGAFEKRLKEAWDQARDEGGEVALILVDIDHFKRYNDCYGHAAGDECLRRVAQRMAGLSNSAGAFTARIGGEEFAVVSGGSGISEARALAALMVKKVQEMAIPHAASFSGDVVTISAGVSTLSTSEGNPQELRLTADRALYEAKRKGRNRAEAANRE